MATPLNAFKTKVWSLRDSDASQGKLVYTVPSGITAIVLMAQVANVDSDNRIVDFSFLNKDVGTGIETPLVQKYGVLPNDAVTPLTGKLIIQEGNQILAYSHSVTSRQAGPPGIGDTDDSLKLTLSFLESLNG